MTVKLLSDHDRSAPITCVLSDVDGVMTDGRIYYDAQGVESKAFNVRDGLGIKRWLSAGFQFGIVTARTSPMVDRRAGELGIKHVSQGPEDKLSRVHAMISEMGCELANVCYIGDDIPDIASMRAVALAASPADASTDAKDSADWILRSRGGEGAVRELLERLLRAKGKWSGAFK